MIVSKSHGGDLHSPPFVALVASMATRSWFAKVLALSVKPVLPQGLSRKGWISTH